MAIIFLRSLLIYIVLLIVMRFMGKRQIGEMQPFEFVVTLLIAELACIPMSDTSIPLLYGVSAIFAVFILHQIITLLEQSGIFMKFLVSGKPSVVINKNGIDFKELKSNNLDVSDLIESLRGLGYYSLSAIKYAIYESNGTLSAVVDENKNNLEMSFLIIKNKKPINKNLKLIGYSYEELKNFLKKDSLNVNKLEVLTVDGKGNYYAQEINTPFKTGKIKLKEETQW